MYVTCSDSIKTGLTGLEINKQKTRWDFKINYSAIFRIWIIRNPPPKKNCQIFNTRKNISNYTCTKRQQA